MGYYARSTEADFLIPADKMDAALAEYKEWENLFPEKWRRCFYNEHDNLTEVFEDLGFDVAEEDGGLRVYSFDNKWRDQNIALDVFKYFVDENAYISFVGEEGELWRWTPEGVKNAVISWV